MAAGSCSSFIFLANLPAARFGDAQARATVGIGRAHLTVGEAGLTFFAGSSRRTAAHLAGTTIASVQAFGIGGRCTANKHGTIHSIVDGGTTTWNDTSSSTTMTTLAYCDTICFSRGTWRMRPHVSVPLPIRMAESNCLSPASATAITIWFNPLL